MSSGSSAISSSRISSGMISVIIGIIFVSIMTLFVYLLSDSASDNASESYTTLQEFELVKHDGSPFSLADIQDHWNLVFFGYMNCPDVCPATMMQLKQAYEQIMASETAMPLPQVVFISVDGKRDSPANLADYVSYFNASFIGATGTPGQISGITKQLDAFYRIKTGNRADNYEVAHSADLFVIGPRGRVVERISPPFDIHALVNEYKALTGEADALVLNNSSSLLRYGIK